MATRIGCLHAHYSNIAYIQNAIGSPDVDLMHFVDPGLIGRVTTDRGFSIEQAQNKVIEQLEWMAQCKVDAILITCTNYIALLDEGRLSTSLPIFKIDEPFFEAICAESGPQLLLFTNAATVDGTMRRLQEYAEHHHKQLGTIESRVIENTFELFIQGNQEQYASEIADYIKKHQADGQARMISVAQLSMVDAAEQVERDTGIAIGTPLKPLVSAITASVNK
ncbi:MAG: aspartate/glutamate racemase family protein [Candidatus Cohnella colombiensis]|uniref:Aspartate/glutamate racemase family protein n=1 Tax=Candidatus Cohnella colombiensis TaxID=3121368 RepID=A0AA95F3P9_9BACL|nr:MAG: aspartate/glutamate racemase family protein [Cohnella sp.]